jgi:hypothetical protein
LVLILDQKIEVIMVRLPAPTLRPNEDREIYAAVRKDAIEHGCTVKYAQLLAECFSGLSTEEYLAGEEES